MVGEYLDDSVERVPMVDHEGKSGALLERVTLADGRRLIVKSFSPKTDLLMAALGDLVGREYVLWSRGILDRLPPEVGHAVVDGWVDGDETADVADADAEGRGDLGDDEPLVDVQPPQHVGVQQRQLRSPAHARSWPLDERDCRASLDAAHILLRRERPRTTAPDE